MNKQEKEKVEKQITLDLLYSPETLTKLEREQKLSIQEAEEETRKQKNDNDEKKR